MTPLEFGEEILRAAKGYAAEVVVVRYRLGLTRFQQSRIHQSVEQDAWWSGLRLRHGSQWATQWWSGMDRDRLRQAVDHLRTLLQHREPDPNLPPLLPARTEHALTGYHTATEEADAAQRAEWVHRVFQETPAESAYGAAHTLTMETAILNSEGLRLSWQATHAHLSVNVLTARGGAGWAECAHPDATRIHPEPVAQKARQKAERSENARDLPPGTYRVILEPLAVAELVGFIGWLGFSARSVIEGMSPFENRWGETFFHPSFHLVDMPEESPYRAPFDAEGVPKRTFQLVEAGKPQGPVYDLRTAARFQAVSTGHAQAFFESYPYPAHLSVLPGDHTLDTLIATTEQGILVTRLHYLNVTDPRHLTLTGMTRDGTFWVEDGKIRYGLKNLRFHTSLLEAFQHISGITRERIPVGQSEMYGMPWISGGLFPAMRLERFHFPTTTQF